MSHGAALLILWTYSCCPLCAAHGPVDVFLGLVARRRKPRIIRYSHKHPGPAHDGRAQRRCRRIFEYSYPAICDDFVVVCGATTFNSRVAMAAQTAILAKAENGAAGAPSAAAPGPIQAGVAATAAKERRGDKSDDTMPGDDLKAVVKFVHKKDSIRGWSSYSTKAKCTAFLEPSCPCGPSGLPAILPPCPPSRQLQRRQPPRPFLPSPFLLLRRPPLSFPNLQW